MNVVNSVERTRVDNVGLYHKDKTPLDGGQEDITQPQAEDMLHHLV